jgi:hypothetical protein
VNGKALLDGPTAATSTPEARPAVNHGEMPTAASEARYAPDGTVEDRIKNERLEQLALSNAKAREDASIRSGRYILASDSRQEAGRVASRLMTMFEASLTEFSSAIVAHAPASPRDALRVLRMTWREIRIRSAKSTGAEAFNLSATIENIEDMGEGALSDASR